MTSTPVGSATGDAGGGGAESGTPIDKYPALREYFSKLEQLRDAHLVMFQTMWTTGAGYAPDLVLVGILKRSMDLVDAILALTREWNYVAAAPLLRLQLDNLLRVNYIATLNDPTQYVMAVLDGGRLDKLKDAQGRRLTDKRLREFAHARYPWLDRVYEETSQLVHFSGKHYYLTVTGVDEVTGIMKRLFCLGLPSWKEAEITEFLAATAHATDALLQGMAGWVEWKRSLSADHKAQLRKKELLKEQPD